MQEASELPQPTLGIIMELGCTFKTDEGRKVDWKALLRFSLVSRRYWGATMAPQFWPIVSAWAGCWSQVVLQLDALDASALRHLAHCCTGLQTLSVGQCHLASQQLEVQAFIMLTSGTLRTLSVGTLSHPPFLPPGLRHLDITFHMDRGQAPDAFQALQRCMSGLQLDTLRLGPAAATSSLPADAACDHPQHHLCRAGSDQRLGHQRALAGRPKRAAVR